MASKRQSGGLMVVDNVQRRILLIRGQRVILGSDLAHLYGVTPKRLNQQVGRNADRFPDDFMFQLTWEEASHLRLQSATLRSTVDMEAQVSRSRIATLDEAETLGRSRLQIATLKRGRNTKYRPHVFTEHGAIMAATVLNSPQAVKASVFVVRAFVKLRELLSTHVQLAHRLEELERKLQSHDEQILSIIEAIRELMEGPEEPTKPPVGFQTELQGKRVGRRLGRVVKRCV